MQPWNTFAEGDNLDVVPLLAPAYGPFDVVYLDPPYNTGNPFAYQDKVAGRRADRHRAWAAMIRPRLEVVRDATSERGAVFASIDDHEAARLRLLMDEVFGEENFVAQIVVNLNPKGRQLGWGFATSHEYLLVYARALPTCVLEASITSKVDPGDFPLVAEDGRRYRRLPLRNTNKKFNPVTAPTMHFAIYGSPETGWVTTAPFPGALEIKPVFGDGAPAVWRWSAAKIDAQPEDLVCRWVGRGDRRRADVFQRDWLHAGRRKKLRTIWLAEEVGSTDTAVVELKALVGHLFESPKPTGLLRRILETMPDDARVLDPFAGSGTTGHAVALQNAADGGRRTCLSVNSPEPVRTGSNADLAGHTRVSDVTRARLSAVADVVGGGFDEFILDC
ncbi:MAG: site-specific DNA-methyltransferase [Nocardioides sp.]|nr:site-specific DNA-methyltransferase [Nocardioides sp.]